MKRVLPLALALIICSSAAVADEISVFQDPQALSCVLNLVPWPGLNTYYVVDRASPGVRVWHFKIHDASGLAFLGASVTLGYAQLGTWNVDMMIASPSCVTGSQVLMTLYFGWIGDTTPACENYFVVIAAPTSEIPGNITVRDCAAPSNLRAGYGCLTFLGVDPNGGECPGCGCGHPPLSTSETTWGAVKAQYR